jgi:hypothetical protein
MHPSNVRRRAQPLYFWLLPWVRSSQKRKPHPSPCSNRNGNYARPCQTRFPARLFVTMRRCTLLLLVLAPCALTGSLAGQAAQNPLPNSERCDPDEFRAHAHCPPLQRATWEATDGSLVSSDGKLARHFLPNGQNAVHWLELPAQEPTRQFKKVTFVYRIDTSGGLPPSAKPCDAQHAGDQERVNYAATYLFYVPK